MKVPQQLTGYQDARGMADAADDHAIVKMGTLKRWMAYVVGLIPSPGAGVGVRRSAEGDVWSASVYSILPNLTVLADGRVKAGRVGGVFPTIDSTPITGSYTPLDISTSGTTYVVLEVNGDLSKDDDFVQNWTASSASIYTSASDPGPEGMQTADGTATFLLAMFVDGAAVYQADGGDWYFDVVDHRDASGEGTLLRVPPIVL